MNDLFRSCEAIVHDVDFGAVRRWKDEHPGAKVVGYFPVYAPVEIVAASEMLPVGLHGAGDRLDIQYADSRFGSFICSITKTTLELGLTDRLAPFDALLFSSICDTARNLCFVMKRNFPEKYVDFLHLPHNPATDASADFLAEEYRRLAGNLAYLGGCMADDEALRRAIRAYNENRAATRELYALRSERPEAMRAVDLYCVVRAGDVVPVREHTAMLDRALDHLRTVEAKPRDSIRVVVEGAFCEQPPLDLVALLEEAGCYVVDDDLTIGRRWFVEDVPEGGDPLWALAEAYVNGSVYSSVRHDFRRPRFKELIKKARRNRADAVVLLLAKFCEPAYFDYVLFKKELDEAGIPHLLLEFEEKTFTFERLRMEVETFAESLLFA